MAFLDFLNSDAFRIGAGVLGAGSALDIIPDFNIVSDLFGSEDLDLNFTDVIGGANIASGLYDISQNGVNPLNLAQTGLGGFNVLQEGSVGNFGNFGSVQDVLGFGSSTANTKVPSASAAPSAALAAGAPPATFKGFDGTVTPNPAIGGGFGTNPSQITKGLPSHLDVAGLVTGGNGFTDFAVPSADFSNLDKVFGLTGSDGFKLPAAATTAPSGGTSIVAPEGGVGTRINNAIDKIFDDFEKNPLKTGTKLLSAGSLLAGLFADDPAEEAAKAFAETKAQMISASNPASDQATAWKDNYIVARTQQIDEEYSVIRARMEAQFASRGMTDSTVAAQAMNNLDAEYAKIKASLPQTADQAWLEYINAANQGAAVATQTAAQAASVAAAAAGSSVPDFGAIGEVLTTR